MNTKLTFLLGAIFLTGCHTGFCHNEIAMVTYGVPFLGYASWWVHTQFHKVFHGESKTVEQCTKECKEDHG